MLPDGEHDVPPGRLAAVVTYLEMTTPAPARPAALPDGVSCEQKEQIPTAFYRDLFSRVGARDWLWFSRLKLCEADLQAVLQDPGIELHVLTSKGQACGMLELDFRTNGACELAFFGLTRELIGCGAGRYLMNTAIARAWSRPISRFHVHTCTLDSPAALGFYRRSGFVPVRQSVGIEPDPRLNGLLPEDAGAHVPIFRA